MPSYFTFLLVTIILAWVYDFVNGLNDCANAIATTISTNALTPRKAILLAGVLNAAGAFLTTAVAKTIGKDIVDPSTIVPAVTISALVGAIVWGAVCTWFGIPISITHCIVGGIVGAAIVWRGFGVLESAGFRKILVAMILSPLGGFVGGYFLLVGVLWLFRHAHPRPANAFFRRAQIVSASFMALSHGANDTQNAMGIITAGLVIAGLQKDFHVPIWVILGSGFFMTLGTLVGGWRVIKTMGGKVTKLRPVHGFSAETAAAAVILGATFLGAPISTTHVIATAIVGVGASERISRVKWSVVGHIVVTWILTIPGSAAIAAACCIVMRAFGLFVK